ncbi:hypothetical protein Taro_017158 [Colocasia esculenta]|uniref:Uncharacterized protein n=1 Tax=Colocasia esculenta TaxID=4460 RepID=A0A843UYJ8_COLES|nr:hypothetical protein [Colocasia esculenta]
MVSTQSACVSTQSASLHNFITVVSTQFASDVDTSKCVDTQADCVNTTGYWLQNRLLEGTVSVDTQADCVDTTGYCFLHYLLNSYTVSTQHPHVSTPLTLLCSECRGCVDTLDILCRHNFDKIM